MSRFITDNARQPAIRRVVATIRRGRAYQTSPNSDRDRVARAWKGSCGCVATKAPLARPSKVSRAFTEARSARGDARSFLPRAKHLRASDRTLLQDQPATA